MRVSSVSKNKFQCGFAAPKTLPDLDKICGFTSPYTVHPGKLVKELNLYESSIEKVRRLLESDKGDGKLLQKNLENSMSGWVR